MNDMEGEDKGVEKNSEQSQEAIDLNLDEPGPGAALAEMTAERDRLQDQLLRKQAEFENFRKRTEREKKEFRFHATMEAIRAVLPVLDALELALKHASSDTTELHRGLELVVKQFRETLEKMGLKPVEAVGRKFDPHLHHAVEMVESDEHEDQIVLVEHQRGYLFHDRLLRPAMVRVAAPVNKS